MFSTTGPGTDEVTSPALGEDRRSIPAHRLVDGGTRMCGGAGSREYIAAVLLGTAPGPRYVFVFFGAALLVKFRAREERRGGPIESEPCGVSSSASGDGDGESMVRVRVVEGSCDAALLRLLYLTNGSADRSGMSSTKGPQSYVSLPVPLGIYTHSFQI